MSNRYILRAPPPPTTTTTTQVSWTPCFQRLYALDFPSQLLLSYVRHKVEVFRIRDILRRVWNLGLYNGLRIPIQIRIRVHLFSWVALKMPTKTHYFLAFLLTVWSRYIDISLQRWQVIMKSWNSWSQSFSYYYQTQKLPDPTDPDPEQSKIVLFFAIGKSTVIFYTA